MATHSSILAWRIPWTISSVVSQSRTRLGNFHFDFPDGSDGKESASNAGDLGLIPGLGRSPGGGNGNPLQYSCLENPLDGEAWQATVHGVRRSQTGLGG